MAHLPKVEVFQLSVRKVGRNNQIINFNEYMKRLIPVAHNESLDDNQLFTGFFQKLVTELDKEEYFKDERKKKALTLYQQQNEEGTNNTISLNVSGSIIHGIIKGGSFGRKRYRSNINSKNEMDEIAPENVVGDDYYFLLYTPLDFSSGVLIIQSYQDSSIRDTFLSFIKNFFNIGTHKIAPKQFLPRAYEEIFNQNYLLKNISFSSSFSSDEIIGSDEIMEDSQEYEVKVVITPKNNITTMANIRNTVSRFIGTNFNSKALDDFDKKKVSLGNNGPVKGAYFNIGEEMKIRPVIYLEEIDSDTNGIPNFEQLKEKCHEILEVVKLEINP